MVDAALELKQPETIPVDSQNMVERQVGQPAKGKLKRAKEKLTTYAQKLKGHLSVLQRDNSNVDLQDEVKEFSLEQDRLNNLSQETTETEQKLAVTSEKPRELSEAELIQMAKDDFASDISSYRVSNNLVERFVREKVMGAKVNGVNVISIDFEHRKETDNMLRRYISSPNTRVVVLEYFYPELRKNAGRLLSKMKTKEEAEDGWGERLRFARSLSELCQKAGKTVSVVDIANKARFEVDAMIYRCLPIIAGAAWGASGGIGTEAFNYVSPAFLLANAGTFVRNKLQFMLGKGFYDKYKIHEEEKFLLNFDDARRYYAARGVDQLIQEYPPLDGQDNSQIVLLYPRAHGMRIINNLTHPKELAHRLKGPLYRVLGHGLDFSVRTWQYMGQPDAASRRHSWEENDESDVTNWRQVSEKKIPLRSRKAK